MRRRLFYLYSLFSSLSSLLRCFSMYMLQRMKIRNAVIKSVVAIMLLNIIAIVPAIITRHVNCVDMSVLAFIILSHLKFQ